jgi:Fur family transcriptional regulator, peroxide stress response regulator
MLELLRASRRHLSAEELYRGLKNEFPKVSLGTVYRNLSVLAETGEIRKLDFFSDFDRFDPVTTNHYHFVCDRCREIYDLDMPIEKSFERKVESLAGHVVRRHRLEFFGTCRTCIDTNPEDHEGERNGE